MAKKLVEIAQQVGSHIICHGCTGKGNDQVRFETTIKALDPSIKIIAPWRFWDFQSREDLIDYAASHGIPIHQSLDKIYSRDENIWHISHESGNLENPWNEHYSDIHVLSCEPEDAPDEVEYVDIDFDDAAGDPRLLGKSPLAAEVGLHEGAARYGFHHHGAERGPGI